MSMGSGTGFQSTATFQQLVHSTMRLHAAKITAQLSQSNLLLEQLMLKRSQRQRKRYYDLPDSKMLLAQLVGAQAKKFGFEFLFEAGRQPGRCQIKGQDRWFKSMRGAISFWILQHPRAYGKYRLTRKWDDKNERISGRWLLLAPDQYSGDGFRTVAEWVVRPTRQALADILRHQRKMDSKASYARPDTLGWRGWVWDTRNNCLKSPAQGTLWDCGPELRVADWSESGAVRGHAGIHACRLPRGDWRSTRPPSDFMGSDVVGLVERFGKFVLGSEGWRAEWVIIRELLVCDEITAAHVRRAYPEIPVIAAPKGHWLRRGEY